MLVCKNELKTHLDQKKHGFVIYFLDANTRLGNHTTTSVDRFARDQELRIHFDMFFVAFFFVQLNTVHTHNKHSHPLTTMDALLLLFFLFDRFCLFFRLL